MRFVNHVHWKADFVKKEEELSFSVEEKQRLHANFIFWEA